MHKFNRNMMSILSFLVSFLCASYCFGEYLRGGATFGSGVDLQPSYYNNGNPNFGWSLMKKYSKIKTVRIEIEPTKVTQAVDWIKQARAQGYHIVATYHDYTKLGSDDTNALLAAANWWKANYHTLNSGQTSGLTINLMNEWGSHSLSSSSYASAYNNAMKIVREVYSGDIIIDLPGYGQEAQVAASACSSGALSNPSQVILSAHIYPGAYNQKQGRYFTTADIDYMHSSAGACRSMVGEFGFTQDGSPTNVDVSAVINRAKSYGWSVIGWAWNGDGTGMNMVTPSWSQNAQATSFSINTNYFNAIYNLLP